MSEESSKHIIYGGPMPTGEDWSKGAGSLGEYLVQALTRNKDRIALINGLTDERQTCSEFLEKSMHLANCLHSVGVKDNDVIAVISENRFEFSAVACATFILGSILAPINLTYSESELDHAINLSQPKYIFCSPTAAGKVLNVATLKKNGQFIKKIYLFGDENVFGNNMTLFKDLINKSRIKTNQFLVPQSVNRKDKVAMIMYSSGTTGLSKGVMITHENIMITISLIESVSTFNKLSENPISLLGVVPWFHTYGFLRMIATITLPHEFVFLPRFEETSFLNCIEKYKISVIFMVPTLMIFLAKHPLVDKYDLSSLKELYCGAAPLGKEVEDAVKARIGVRSIKQGYGMSETTLGVIRQTNEKMKPGSVGGLLYGTWAKVVDLETGEALGPNKVGELCFKGPLMMKGYINNEKETRDTIRNGWLHSGDIGYYDDDEEFFIVDRLKELIKYRGFQVPPAELETILLTHPKVQDAAVIGLPDDVSGELPLAFIVKQPNSQVTEKEIVDFVAGQISSSKRLHGGVRFINEIPKNGSGKILRRILRDQLKKELKSKL